MNAGEIDLTRAVVVVPDGLSSTESKAVRVLVEEVRRRTRIRWDAMIRWPTRRVPVIAVGPERLLDSLPRAVSRTLFAPARRQGTRRISHSDRQWAATGSRRVDRRQ